MRSMVRLRVFLLGCLFAIGVNALFVIGMYNAAAVPGDTAAIAAGCPGPLAQHDACRCGYGSWTEKR